MQLERCTTRREYVYVSVVQYMAWAAWAACVIYMGVCACTYVLCLYHLHSVSAWIAWAMYRFAYTRVLERVLRWTAWAMHRLRLGPHARLGRCTCTRTVYGIYSLSDAPIVLRPACLCLHVELILVQFMAWTVWAMHRSCPCAWARPAYLYPSVFGIDSLGDVPIVRWPACLDSHAVLVPLQYSAWKD